MLADAGGGHASRALAAALLGAHKTRAEGSLTPKRQAQRTQTDSAVRSEKRLRADYGWLSLAQGPSMLALVTSGAGAHSLWRGLSLKKAWQHPGLCPLDASNTTRGENHTPLGGAEEGRMGETLPR